MLQRFITETFSDSQSLAGVTPRRSEETLRSSSLQAGFWQTYNGWGCSRF
jgi:hypothetical protein